MGPVKRPHPLATCTSAAEADAASPQVLAKRKRNPPSSTQYNDSRPIPSSQEALPKTAAPETGPEDDDNDTASILSTSSSDPSSFSSSDAESDLDADASASRTTSSAETKTARSALREQLRAFIPQLRAANEALDLTAGSAFEIVDAGAEGDAAPPAQDSQGDQSTEEPYIEMELGLGVLEEKKAGASDSDDDDVEDGAAGQDDVLGRLMGRKRRGEAREDGVRKVVIQEL